MKRHSFKVKRTAKPVDNAGSNAGWLCVKGFDEHNETVGPNVTDVFERTALSS